MRYRDQDQDWDHILETFTELYLDERDLDIKNGELEEYPSNTEEVSSDEELGEYIRKITKEIDRIYEEY